VAFKVQVSLFQAGPWVRINRLQASLAHPCHTPLAVASRHRLLPLYPSHTSDPDSKGSSFLPQRSSCWSPYSSGRRGFPLFGSIHGERASWTISSPPRPRPPGLASIGLAWTLLPVNHPCWFLMGACAPSHGGPGGNLLARSQVSSSNRPSLPDFRRPPESHTGPNPFATLFQCASPQSSTFTPFGPLAYANRRSPPDSLRHTRTVPDASTQAAKPAPRRFRPLCWVKHTFSASLGRSPCGPWL